MSDRRSGDAAFTDFVTATSRRLLHAADLLTGDRPRAEDLVQHALARTHVRWDSVRDNDPEAFVRRAMLNHYLDWWRRRRWREVALSDTDDWATSGDDATAIAGRDAVQQALQGLTRRERGVVVLRYWFDLTEEQIADELDIARGTVKSTCARALTRLRASPHLSDIDTTTTTRTTKERA